MAKPWLSIVAKNVRAWCIFGTIPGDIMAVPPPTRRWSGYSMI
jgi:hypothetical protein